MNDTPVTQALKQLNVPHRLFRHPGPVNSLEQAAVERNQEPDQVVRSLLFRLRKDNYVMVLVTGNRQVNWRILRRYLGQSRVSMAKPEEVIAVTGYQIGTVSPIGLPQPLRILVDASVVAQTEISIGSGERNATVILQTSDLMAVLPSAEVENFVDDS
ncbi:MAG: YbaK/EbsC family protein [Chloroflexota bacterium]